MNSSSVLHGFISLAPHTVPLSYNKDTNNKYLFSVLLLYKYFSEKVKILEGNFEKNLATVLGQIKLIDLFDTINI